MESKTDQNIAFTKPIEEGNSRILLKLQVIETEVENNAPDFINVEDDEVDLKVQTSNEIDITIPQLEEAFKVNFKRVANKGEVVHFELENDCIWFDLPTDNVKDVWIDELNFSLISKNSRYINYYIKTLDHQLEWLQPDLKTGEIRSMSVSTKKFKPPKISGKESFTAKEVIRCADMIGRSVQKIDIRTGGAYVKFNTDKGRLEPLIIGIAEKLGYIIEPLDKEVIQAMDEEGKSVSHAIYLRKL